MATIANLNILLTMEDQATKTLTKAQRDLNKIGKSMQQWGAGLTAAVTVPVIAGAAAIVNMASDQQEAINAVSEVYGSAAETVLAYGDAAAQSMGLAKAEYLSAAAVFGVYSTAAGLAGQEAAEFANNNLQLAADLGSFFNASTEDVTSALQAAYRGEFDALDRYGIMLNQTTLEQFALAEGIHDGNGAMTTQQRILATNAYMQQRAGAATGDFARTSNSLANSQKILRAQIKDVGAQLGNVLLPTVTRVVAVFRELLTRFQGLPESWQRWIVLIALAAAAIGPLLIVLGTLLTVLPAIGAALAVLTGPIGLVVAAIALLTAAYIGNWWGFRDAVDGVASSVSTLLTRLNEFALVNSVVTSAVNAVTGLLDRLGRAFEKTGSGIMSGNWRKALAGIGDLLAAPAKAIGEFVRGIETGFAPLDALLDGIGGYFVDMGRTIQEVFQGDLRGALSVFTRLLLRVPTTMLNIFRTIDWSGVGETLRTGFAALPGFIEGASTVLYQKGRELLGGVLMGISNTLPAVLLLISVIPGLILSAAGDYLTLLYQKGRELMGGVLMGISETLPAVMLLVSVLGTMAFEAAGDLALTLVGRGKQLIAGVLTGWSEILPIVMTNIGMLGEKSLEAAGDLALTLVSKGKQLIAGVLTGWYEAIPGLQTTLSFLGSTAATAVGDLASTLWFKGWDLVEGFVKGMLARIPYLEEVAGTMASIVAEIVSAWNKITSPSRLMMELGGYMAEGLALGMERGIPRIESAAGAMSTAASVGIGVEPGRARSVGAGSGFYNYGTLINEAPRYPDDAADSYAIARSRG